MNKQEYLKTFKMFTERMYAITEAKNSDYTGDDADPFKNFKMVELMGSSSTEQGFLTRMTDKQMRLASFVRNGTLMVKDESVEDTLLDLANYCLLFACYLREQKTDTGIEVEDEPIRNSGTGGFELSVTDSPHA